MTTPPRTNTPLCVMLAVVALATAWSAIGAHDDATWFFELAIGAAGVAALVAIAPRFRFSPIVYLVAAAHFVILAIGAKYTYSLAPPGEWLRTSLTQSRKGAKSHKRFWLRSFLSSFAPWRLCVRCIPRFVAKVIDRNIPDRKTAGGDAHLSVW